MRKMRVFIGCEFSGVVRDTFTNKGHIAVSADFLPSDTIGPHHKGDMFDLVSQGWDLIIAHPPCTYLCNSGVRWLNDDPKRWHQMTMAGAFFRSILEIAPKYCPRIAVENPIPHRYAIAEIGRKYNQIIQPWQFGHGETKATCLWLKGLPELKPTKIVDGRDARIHKMPPSKDRARLRSITYQGIADAMADQWG